MRPDTHSMEARRDVIVIGGGPGGSATALALARCGWSVTVIERSDYHDMRIGESLAPSIRPQLQALGLWQSFQEDSHLPAYGVLNAWGSGELYDNAYIFDPYGVGWHIDRRRFDAMVARSAEHAGAEVCRRARVTSYFYDGPDGWHVEFVWHGKLRRMRARFLVDATGRTSPVRQQLGVKDSQYDQLVGVAGVFAGGTNAPSPNACTLIETTPQGWWYSAPLPSAQLMVVYMTDLDLYVQGRRAQPRFWYECLRDTQHTRRRVRHLRPVGRRRAYIAGSHCVEHVQGPNWLPVGDAVAALDPLCGKGISMALRTAVDAAERIAAYLEGERHTLTGYTQDIARWFAHYLAHRQHYYAQENRWCTSPFWHRRQALAAISR